MRLSAPQSLAVLASGLSLTAFGCGSSDSPPSSADVSEPSASASTTTFELPSGARLVSLPGRGLVGAVAETATGRRAGILFEPHSSQLLATIEEVGPAEFRFAIAHEEGLEPEAGTVNTQLKGSGDEPLISLLHGLWVSHHGALKGVDASVFDGLAVFDFPFDGLAGEDSDLLSVNDPKTKYMQQNGYGTGFLGYGFCSDGICSAELGESCSTCSVDCGACFSCDPPACSGAVSIERRSLLISAATNNEVVGAYPEIMARFPLRSVLEQIIAIEGSDTTADELFQRLWQTMSVSDGDPRVQHCTSPINGFAIECPRSEEALSVAATPEDFVPVGLFNRFDLARLDGSSCGEYRIVFANSGLLQGQQRTLIIFEGMLPPPDAAPADCFEACRPVADFWAGLSSVNDAVSLADQLQSFYFNGLVGFRPVIHPRNYGLDAPIVTTGYNGAPVIIPGGPSGGQIRTNSIVPPQVWQLREFHVAHDCTTLPCDMFMQPVTVKANPAGELFNGASTNPLAPAFRADFLAGIASLTTPTDINQIALNLPGTYDHGQSSSQNPQGGTSESNYLPQFGLSSSWLPNQGALTKGDVVRRAQTQACAGCHHFSANVSLGGGLVWPNPNIRNGQADFTHIDEDGLISAALDTQFLPHREVVMESFLANCAAPGAPGPFGLSPLGETIGSMEADVERQLGGLGAAHYVVAGQKTLGGSTTH